MFELVKRFSNSDVEAGVDKLLSSSTDLYSIELGLLSAEVQRDDDSVVLRDVVACSGVTPASFSLSVEISLENAASSGLSWARSIRSMERSRRPGTWIGSSELGAESESIADEISIGDGVEPLSEPH